MRNRPTIGIEIAADEVRGAYVRGSGSSVELVAAASVPLPPNGRDDSGLLDAQEVGEAVRRVCAQFDTRGADVVLGLTDCSLVARIVEIPPVPDSEVRAVLRGEMDYYRILPAGQSAFDYYKLPAPPEQSTESEEAEALRVLLIGAEERLVANYRSVADTTNLNLVAVEPGSIAVLRALYPMVSQEPAVATVILSSTGTDVLITQEGGLQFYRRIDTGIHELFTRGAAPGTVVPEAQQRGPMLGSFEEADQAQPAAAAPVDVYNRQAISLLMTEVQRSIDYFKREYPTAAGNMPVRFVLGLEEAPELFEVLSEYLRGGAELAQPFERLTIGAEATDAVSGPRGVRYTVAVGLALRRCGGDYAGAPALDLGVGDRVIVDRRAAPKLMLVSATVSGFVLVGTIIAALLLATRTGDAERALRQTQHELDALTAEHAAKVAVLERQKKLTDAIYFADKPIRQGLEFLSASINRQACLTELAMDNKGQITLQGEAKTTRAVADIMDAVNRSPALEPVRLESLQRASALGVGSEVTFQIKSAFTPKPAPPPSPVGAAGSAPAGQAATAAAGTTQQGGH